MVIHADGGEITVEITPEKIDMILDDKGPGIKDVELAMQVGYSRLRMRSVLWALERGWGFPI